jgi:hypothetical protein
MTTVRTKPLTGRGTATPGEQVAETNTPPITPDAVRAELFRVWGLQACQHPQDWPRVKERLAENYSQRGCRAVAAVRTRRNGAGRQAASACLSAGHPREPRRSLCNAVGDAGRGRRGMIEADEPGRRAALGGAGPATPLQA